MKASPASLSAAAWAGCAAGGGLQRTLLSWRAYYHSRPLEGGWRQQSRAMSSSVGKNGPRRPLKARAEDFDYHVDFARTRAGEAAQPPKKGACTPASGGIDDGVIAGISSLRNSRGRPKDDAARKDEMTAQAALDQKLLKQHVDKELELWMRVEKEGGHRDIFQVAFSSSAMSLGRNRGRFLPCLEAVERHQDVAVLHRAAGWLMRIDGDAPCGAKANIRCPQDGLVGCRLQSLLQRLTMTVDGDLWLRISGW